MTSEIVVPTLIEATNITLDKTLEELVAGHLSPNTRRAYRQDAQHFINWLAEQQLILNSLNKNDLIQYRRYLADNFAKASAARKLTVAKKLLEEAASRGLISTNPATGVKSYKNTDQQETPHKALDVKEARQLLAAIDTTTKQGKRDYAIIMLLLRTGIRRSECAELQLGDLSQEQGYHIATLRHTKGDKRRKVKIPVDVRGVIEEYLEATNRKSLPATAPLFVQFRRGDWPQEIGIKSQLIERIVEKYALQIGLKLSPHALRATFVTLALEGGAKLHQVQYAVGHTDPRTTERYQKRKFNLESNAVDYIHLT